MRSESKIFFENRVQIVNIITIKARICYTGRCMQIITQMYFKFYLLNFIINVYFTITTYVFNNT